MPDTILEKMDAEEAKLRFEADRQKMVDDQLRRRGISDERVLRAFEVVRRELFVPEEYVARAYDDCPQPIGFGQTISQPYVVALSLQELDLRAEHRVLDVGCGSGYQAALLGLLVREVYGVERIAELAERARGALAAAGVRNVMVKTGDGVEGWAEHGPYDRIVCGAAAEDVPAAWVDQLADGGRMVAPLGWEGSQELVAVDKKGGKLTRRGLCAVRFVPLIGN